MAKTLRDPFPSSAVARLLDRGAAIRATQSNNDQGGTASMPTAGEPSNAVKPASVFEIPAIKREFVLTPAADETFSRLLSLYRRATRTRLSGSHVFRVMMIAVDHCMSALECEALDLGPHRLPPNGKNHESHRQAFEERLAEAFVAGMRSAAAFRSAQPETARRTNQSGS